MNRMMTTADTGLQIDRSVARRSFLGLPIYLAVGDTVYCATVSD